MNQTKQQITHAKAQRASSKSTPTPQNQQLTADQLLKKLQELGATASFLNSARKTLEG